MSAAALWEIGYGLTIYGALLIGASWLTVLSCRVRQLHQRLATHTCRDTDRPRHSDPERLHGSIPVAVLLQLQEQEQHRTPLPARRPPINTSADHTDLIDTLPTTPRPSRPPGGSGNPRSQARPAPPTDHTR